MRTYHAATFGRTDMTMPMQLHQLMGIGNPAFTIPWSLKPTHWWPLNVKIGSISPNIMSSAGTDDFDSVGSSLSFRGLHILKNSNSNSLVMANASNNTMKISSPSSALAPQSGMSYDFWIRPSDISSTGKALLTYRIDSSNLVSIKINTSGDLRFLFIVSGTTVQGETSPVITAGGSYHVTIALNDAVNALALFVDGVSVGLGGSGSSGGDAEFRIGSTSSDGQKYIGDFSSLRVWDRELVVAEAKQLFYAGV